MSEAVPESKAAAAPASKDVAPPEPAKPAPAPKVAASPESSKPSPAPVSKEAPAPEAPNPAPVAKAPDSVEESKSEPAPETTLGTPEKEASKPMADKKPNLKTVPSLQDQFRARTAEICKELLEQSLNECLKGEFRKVVQEEVQKILIDVLNMEAIDLIGRVPPPNAEADVSDDETEEDSSDGKRSSESEGSEPIKSPEAGAASAEKPKEKVPAPAKAATPIAKKSA